MGYIRYGGSQVTIPRPVCESVHRPAATHSSLAVGDEHRPQPTKTTITVQRGLVSDQAENLCLNNERTIVLKRQENTRNGLRDMQDAIVADLQEAEQYKLRAADKLLYYRAIAGKDSFETMLERAGIDKDVVYGYLCTVL